MKRKNINSNVNSDKNLIEYYKNVLRNKVPDALENRTMDEVYKTGFTLFDEIIGGIPKGRIVNIASEPGCGKTTLLVQLASKLTQFAKIVVYIDTEGSMSFRRLNELGLDLSNILYLQPKTLEDAYASIITLLREKISLNDDSNIVFCFDSITAAPTMPELNVSEDDLNNIVNTQIGYRARINSKTFPLLSNLLIQTNSVLIMVNQQRKNIQTTGYFFGPQEEIVGGLSLLYYSSIDIRLSVKSSFKNLFESQEILGKVVYFKAKKNRIMSPLIEFPMVLDYNKGFDDVLSLFVFLLDTNKSDFKQVELEDTFYSSGPVYKIINLHNNKELTFKSSEFVERFKTDKEFKDTVLTLVVTFIRRFYKKYPNNYIYNPNENEEESIKNEVSTTDHIVK